MKKLIIISLVFLLCFTFACQHGEEVAALEEHDASSNLPGFIFSEPAPNRDGKIKILLHYDMEGLSGQGEVWRPASVDYTEKYKKYQELLTADVNAVIEGLFDGGADEIYVWDGHAGPKPDIILEQMDSRAKFIYSEKIPKGKSLWEYYVIDAIAVVGMHSKTGGGGFMAHTMFLGIDYILNGRSINETEILMLRWGQYDIPVIFASGDDKLKEQLQPYPWIEYVTVKLATNAFTADLRPVDEVHKEMRIAAGKSVKNISRAKTVKLKIPIKAGLRTEPPGSLGILNGVPGIDYKDDTVFFEAKNCDEALGCMIALTRVAKTGLHEVLVQTVSNQDNAKKIWDEYWKTIFNIWLDIKSNQ